MNQPLTERILNLLTDSTSDDVVNLAWAAVQSDAELAEVAGGTLRSRPQPTGAGPQPAPIGAFLSSLSVTGFRGVGPEVKISFCRGPA